MNAQEPVEFTNSKSVDSQANSDADCEKSASNHTVGSEVDLKEPKDLREKEEYRASQRVSNSVSEPEDINQEEEDRICDHDVLRDNGV